MFICWRVRRTELCELFEDAENAISREKLLKSWKRQWKIDLIEKDNPDWNDLNKCLN